MWRVCEGLNRVAFQPHWFTIASDQFLVGAVHTIPHDLHTHTITTRQSDCRLFLACNCDRVPLNALLQEMAIMPLQSTEQGVASGCDENDLGDTTDCCQRSGGTESKTGWQGQLAC